MTAPGDKATSLSHGPARGLPPSRQASSLLVVGTDLWAVEQAVAQLTGAGRDVHRCSEPGEAPFPCNALVEGRRCPLDVGVDVVLDVRARPVTPPPLTEFGAVCALHAGVPLVVAGVAWEGGFGPWAAERVAQSSELASACDAAVGETA